MTAALRWTGSLPGLPALELEALCARGRAGGQKVSIQVQVRELLAEVRSRGDLALRELALRFDRVRLEALEVPPSSVRAALDRQPAEVQRALARSAQNIARVHAAFRPVPLRIEVEPGVQVERRPDPLDRVGVYAPGGRAAYPSSVLMGAIPARVAGVREVVLCSPPDRSGLPSQQVLAAAAVAEVDRVFAVGGVGAVGALAFGTRTIPRVDRIVGPGNAWVSEAKLQVAGEVGIDAPAGPSELLVLLDEQADLEAVAREMLAQAEHDPDAAVVAVALDPATGRRLAERLLARVSREPRAGIISAALAGQGAVLWTEAIEEALAFAQRWAPEHVLLALDEGPRIAGRIRNAGTVLVGGPSSGAFGDYTTGANHVLPTAGSARNWSGLSTLDFVRWTTIQTLSPAGAASLACDTELLATIEGLPAHATAARAWRHP